MADVAAIFAVASRGSRLALSLYRAAALAPDAACDLNRIAKSISNFSIAVKQVGTIIKENDDLPSSEAVETLEDIGIQYTALAREIEAIVPVERIVRQDNPRYRNFQLGTMEKARLYYLTAHLDSLKCTVSVLLQALHTAQSIIWARVRPTISPHQTDNAVTNEKTQLKLLIIEQQMSFLATIKRCEISPSDPRLLAQINGPNSLITRGDKQGVPGLADLLKYQEGSLARLNANKSKDEWFTAVCAISEPHVEVLLKRWTRLRQLEERIDDEDRRVVMLRRQSQQPMVESDDEEQISQLRRLRFDSPLGSPPVQMVPQQDYGRATPGPGTPTSPVSPYGTPPSSSTTTSPPLGLRSPPPFKSSSSDPDPGLEIPWRLCSRGSYWQYIDSLIISSNTDQPALTAYSDRKSWTELTAAWVCKEALDEAGLSYTQFMKDKPGVRPTQLETCYRIEGALGFGLVQQLVERTIIIYRQRQGPKPGPGDGEGMRALGMERANSVSYPQAQYAGYGQTPNLHRSTSLPSTHNTSAYTSNSHLPNYDHRPSPLRHTHTHSRSPRKNKDTPPLSSSEDDQRPRRSRSRGRSSSSHGRKKETSVSKLAMAGALATLVGGIYAIDKKLEHL